MQGVVHPVPKARAGDLSAFQGQLRNAALEQLDAATTKLLLVRGATALDGARILGWPCNVSGIRVVCVPMCLCVCVCMYMYMYTYIQEP